MEPMMTRAPLLRAVFGTVFLSLAASNTAWPQTTEPTVAALKSVVGNVLVSKETGLASGADDARLARGTRVITTTNSEAIVKYDDGCEVHLKPNQRYVVDTDKPCEALIAQVESILAEPMAAAPAGGAGLLGYAVPAAGAVGTTLLIIQSRRQGSAVSPN